MTTNSKLRNDSELADLKEAVSIHESEFDTIFSISELRKIVKKLYATTDIALFMKRLDALPEHYQDVIINDKGLKIELWLVLLAQRQAIHVRSHYFHNGIAKLDRKLTGVFPITLEDLEVAERGENEQLIAHLRHRMCRTFLALGL